MALADDAGAGGRFGMLVEQSREDVSFDQCSTSPLMSRYVRLAPLVWPSNCGCGRGGTLTDSDGDASNGRRRREIGDFVFMFFSTSLHSKAEVG